MGRNDAPTFVYHVGAHKTGTSLLQNYLVEHRPALREQRILYMGRAVAEVIARAEEDPQITEQADQQLRKFRRRRKLFDTFVASFENALGPPFSQAHKASRLYPRAAARCSSLAKTLRPFRPKILLSIRPPVEFVESYYLQFVHQGGYLTFEEWLDLCVDLDGLSWRPVVDDLVSAFGPEAIEIVDFRIIRTGGTEGYLRDLLGRIAPNAALEVGVREVSNASVSDKGLRLALAANPHLQDADEQRQMRKFLQGRFSNLRYPRPVLLSDDRRQWLSDRYAQDYDELVRAWNASPAPSSEQPAG